MHIVGQRDDGYHLLESVVCFTEFGDEISIEITETQSGFSLEIDGPYSASLNESTLSNADNLVLKAANFALGHFSKDKTNSIGGKITLTKNLPISSGIGGGSADAAATIRAITQLSGSMLNQALIAGSAHLGADVPMCMHSTPMIARGIGDEIDLLSDVPSFHILLVNPNVAVSTPVIFKQLASKNNSSLSELPLSPRTDNWIEFLSNQRNDLQKPAIIAESIIGDVINSIIKTDALLARMSGSGATCFGLFESATACEAARLKVINEQPTWWCVATKTLTD